MYLPIFISALTNLSEIRARTLPYYDDIQVICAIVGALAVLASFVYYLYERIYKSTILKDTEILVDDKKYLKAGSLNGKQSNFEYDIAISYAGEDRRIVEMVAKKLVENNVRVFYDKFEKPQLWGKRLSKHFQQVYGEKARFVLIFVSKEYSVKDWTNFEFTIARGAAKVRKTEFILPVRLDNTLLLGLSEDIHYLDFNTEGIEGIVNAVIDKVNELKKNLDTKFNFNDSNKKIIAPPSAPNIEDKNRIYKLLVENLLIVAVIGGIIATVVGGIILKIIFP